MSAHYCKIECSSALVIKRIQSDTDKCFGFSLADIQSSKDFLSKRLHPEDLPLLNTKLQSINDDFESSLHLRLRNALGKYEIFFVTIQQEETEDTFCLDFHDVRQIPKKITGLDISLISIVMETTDDFIFFKDNHHVLITASQSMVDLCDPINHWHEFNGKTDYEIFPEKLADCYYSLETSIYNGESIAHEIQPMQHKNGQSGWVDNRKYPIHDDDGNVIGLYGIARDITNQINAINSQRVTSSIFENTFDRIVIINPLGEIINANSLFAEFYGFSVQELVGKHFSEVNTGTNNNEVFEKHWNALLRNGNWQGTVESVNKSGKKRIELVRFQCAKNIDGELLWFIGIYTDITEQHNKQIALDSFFEQGLSLNAIISKKGVFVKVNKHWETILGYKKAELEGQHFYNFIHPEDIEATINEQNVVINHFKSSDLFENRYMHKDGSYRLLSWSAKTSPNDNRIYTVAVDITEKRKIEEQLIHSASHDSLTNLYNREYFNNLLERKISVAQRLNTHFALMFIDLDRFKHINDSMGHQAGDILLIEATKRMQSRLRKGDTLARIGGDEFAVILEGTHSVEQAMSLAKGLANCFEENFLIQSQSVNVSISQGISLFPEDGNNRVSLLANADSAMYEAKRQGRNAICFYNNQLTAQAQRFVFLESALKTAIREENFTLDFQPQFDFDGNIKGIEALIRWSHPESGFIPPDSFIPIAEQCGLMREIGNWVLATACAFARKWIDLGVDFGVIAVNISGQQFDREDFIDDVIRITTQKNILPQYVELELTESIIMNHRDDTVAKLMKLRSLGFSLSIDDFGTGYSSLNYLKKLPFNALKIDKSFVDEIPDDEEDIAICEAIMMLGKILKFNIIVEGLETQAQYNFFKGKNCTIQGYFLSKPIPHNLITNFLTERSAKKKIN